MMQRRLRSQGLQGMGHLPTATRVLQVIKDIGELQPLSPLKPICGILVIILQNIEAVRKIREDVKALTFRAAELLLGIAAEIFNKPHPLSQEMLHRIEKLQLSLRVIQDDLLLLGKMGWRTMFLRTQDLKDRLATQTIRLDDCCQLFTTASLVSIEQFLYSQNPVTATHLRALSQTLLLKSDRIQSVARLAHEQYAPRIQSIAREVRMISAAGFASEFRHIDLNQLLFDDAPGQDGDLPRAQLANEGGLTSYVVVKRFPIEKSREKFIRSVNLWRRLRHPNCYTALGISPPGPGMPYVVLPYYPSCDIFDYVGKQLQETEAHSFLETLKVLHGIASGLEFLRRANILTKPELEKCAQPTNFTLSSDGRVILGKTVVEITPSTAVQRNGDVLHDWLRELFFRITIDLVYHKEDIDYSDWKFVMAQSRHGHGNSRHLRFLENFCYYGIPSFTQVMTELESLRNELEAKRRHGCLTFPDIRRAAMSIRCGAYIFRPKVPLEVRVADVGYMKDGKPVILKNVQDEAQFSYTEPSAIQLSSRTPPIPGQSDGSGLLRHQFKNTVCAIVRRHSGSRIVSNFEHAWQFLLTNAKSICSQYSSPSEAIHPEDLILVVGIQDHLRYTYLEVKGQNSDAVEAEALPQDVEYVEYEKAEINKPWGYWIPQTGDGLRLLSKWTPQNIFFIQVENSDIA